MRKELAAGAAFLLGAAAAYASLHVHALRTSDGFVWIRKRDRSWRGTYVDVRGWTSAEWKAHPELKQAVIESGRRDLVPADPPWPLIRQLFPDRNLRRMEVPGARHPERN